MTSECLSWALSQETGDPLWSLVLIQMSVRTDEDRGHWIHSAEPAEMTAACGITPVQLSWAKWNLRERGYTAWFAMLGQEEVWRMRPKPDFDPCRLSGPWKQKRRPPARRRIPHAVREAVVARDGSRCTRCGSLHDLTLDHVYPYSLGGPDTVENLRVLCRSCNSRKGVRVE